MCVIAAALRSGAVSLLLSALACPIRVKSLRVPGPSDDVTAATFFRLRNASAAHVPHDLLNFYHKSRQRKRIRTNVTRLAVCVTGQLSRLETESKLKNFLMQESQTVADVDLFVVMEVNSSIFVNKNDDPTENVKAHRGDKLAAASCHRDFRNANQVEERFAPFYRSGLYLGHVDWKNVNWDNWGPYLSGHNEKRHAWNKEARMQSHLNQWFKWSECSDLIQKAEQEDVSRGGKPYDLVVRIRDNGIVVMPWSVTAPGSKWLELQSVAVKGCSNHGGVHDKFMVAPRSLAIEALTSPFTYSMKVNSGDQTAVEYFRGVGNPEQFVKWSWKGVNVKFHGEKGNDMPPVIDGRCVAANFGSSRTFCIVHTYKDCHPTASGFREDAYQTCKLKNTAFGEESEEDLDD
eukprot:gnl/TRDRNA2_/TRDRNA2_176941_c0_seq33.p1 gnl/TRDRNA2_/TRDRNA2_176941_c0~~gnl/TRDRNA2_/TRDRNA2_176941_c0_seq33.p1  ORF type:complete len:404 (+),score=49.91 gnl/TRDRNA2_/TRDRNA2_176941_c0_seq33:84-1295(+)